RILLPCARTQGTVRVHEVRHPVRLERRTAPVWFDRTCTGPGSPTGRGVRLKPDPVWVRIPPGAPYAWRSPRSRAPTGSAPGSARLWCLASRIVGEQITWFALQLAADRRERREAHRPCAVVLQDRQVRESEVDAS